MACCRIQVRSSPKVARREVPVTGRPVPTCRSTRPACLGVDGGVERTEPVALEVEVMVDHQLRLGPGLIGGFANRGFGGVRRRARCGLSSESPVSAVEGD